MESAHDHGTPGRPRVVVTTDPELDDLNSMLRLLLYSNEIRIAGLVYSSSQFHYAGDPATGVDPHRWPSDDYVGHIDEAVDAYAKVEANLRVHDPRYPTAASLRSLIAQGNIATEGDTSEETDGSRLIERLLLDGEDDLVFLQAWGGTNTIARALMSIERDAVAAGTWDEVYRTVVARAVITSFGLQDSTFADYIRPRWPDLEHREVATLVWGYFARQVVESEDLRYLSAAWMRENVTGMGPMGATYRVWGDGKQMAAGFDAEDYFGVAGATEEQLTAQGYGVWCPVQEDGAWISEGDSSNFALLVDNGLRAWERPENGGWGGRQARNPHDPAQWTNALADDALPDGMEPAVVFGQTLNDYSAARWCGAFQRDLAARLRWSVTPDRAAANHHPRLAVTPGLDVTAEPGDEARLGLTASDPDGDDVTLRAWVYREAGTCQSEATAVVEEGELVIAVPVSARSGDSIHVIVEATDDGAPPLTAYARVILTVS